MCILPLSAFDKNTDYNKYGECQECYCFSEEKWPCRLVKQDILVLNSDIYYASLNITVILVE